MQRLLPLFCFVVISSLQAAQPPGPARVPLLVLPFFNQSAAELDWIGESVAQRISHVLLARGWAVMDREERLEAYRRLSLRPLARLTRASLLKVALELDAALVVSGEFQVEGSAQVDGPGAARGRILRLSGFLLDVRRLAKGLSWVEEGSLEDLATVENRFAWQVLRGLAPEQAPPLEEFLAQNPPVRPDAIENYVRGLLAASPQQKHRYFTQAARLDPRFPQPAFELGRLEFQRKEYRLAAGWLGRVPPSDPDFLRAQFLLGLCRYYSADFAGAAAAFERVSREAPLNEVLNNLAAAQSRRNLPEALDLFLEALDGDPADPDYHFNAGYVLWKRGEFQAAAERFRAALRQNPEDTQATLLLGRCLQGRGPRPGDPEGGLERIKHSFQERAWRELKARVAPLEP